MLNYIFIFNEFLLLENFIGSKITENDFHFSTDIFLNHYLTDHFLKNIIQTFQNNRTNSANIYIYIYIDIIYYLTYTQRRDI